MDNEKKFLLFLLFRKQIFGLIFLIVIAFIISGVYFNNNSKKNGIADNLPQKSNTIATNAANNKTNKPAINIQIPLDAEYGNISENISNGSFAVTKGEWVYYTNSFDKYRLYKEKLDRTQKLKITDEVVSEISVVGNWVYYTSLGGDDSFNIYKITLDGENKTQLTNFPCQSINVINDWIFFVSRDNNKICCMKTDGTGVTLLNNILASQIIVKDNWIYLDGGTEKEHFGFISNAKLYKMKINGTDLAQLTQDNINCINVNGDYTYYVNISDQNSIYRIENDGSDRTKVTDSPSNSFIIHDNWIYSIKPLNKNRSSLYRFSLDSNKKEDLNQSNIESMNVVSDYIYYYNSNEKREIYDYGDDNTPIMNKDGIINYSMYTQVPLYRMNFDGTDKTILN